MKEDDDEKAQNVITKTVFPIHINLIHTTHFYITDDGWRKLYFIHSLLKIHDKHKRENFLSVNKI